MESRRPTGRASGSPSLAERIAMPSDGSVGLATDADASVRVRGSRVDQRFIDSLRTEIERLCADDDFATRVERLLERDREILDRLAR